MSELSESSLFEVPSDGATGASLCDAGSSLRGSRAKVGSRACSGPPSVVLGTVIDGRYRVEHFLAGGAMGEVYTATQLELRRQVAIKFLRPERLLDRPEEVLRRFRREAYTTARLDHPNILPIYDYGMYESRPYLVMKHLQGATLREVLAEQGPLSIDRCLRICRDLAAALELAHSRNVVHRDLKPANVLLLHPNTPAERAVILDFGIAKFLGSDENLCADTTSENVLLGTPLYMSPEQIRRKAVDPRSDIYSLSVLMFQCLSGRFPFEGDSPFEVLIGHLNHQPESILSFRPELPVGLGSVLEHALAKDPSERHQTALEFLQHFESSLVSAHAQVRRNLATQGGAFAHFSRTQADRLTSICRLSSRVWARTRLLVMKNMSRLAKHVWKLSRTQIPKKQIACLLALILVSVVYVRLFQRTASPVRQSDGWELIDFDSSTGEPFEGVRF